MTQKVTLIPGDGLTKELTPFVLSVLDAAGADVEFEEVEAGKDAFAKHGTALPKAALDSIRKNGIALKGKLVSGGEAGCPSGDLRKELGLFATVRPIKNLKGLKARYDNIDIVIVRESTEDVYAGLEHVVSAATVASLKVVTAEACERISRFAFEYAKKNGRKKVTLVHKANIMKVTDGLFIAEAKKVAAEYEGEIEFNTLIVDNASMQLLLRPYQYDVMLMGNLYGDILSDLGAGIVGGISNTMGASVNDELQVFEALHGDAPSIVGTGTANPLPLLMPACYMLESIGQADVADKIRTAISKVLESGTSTPDLGGTATTASFIDAVKAAL